MRSCPACQFLVDPDLDVCRFCGAEIAEVEREAAEAKARAAEAVVEAVATRSSRPPVAVLVSAAVGLVVVALVGALLFAGGGDDTVSSAAGARKLAVRPPVSSDLPTTTAVTLQQAAGAAGYTVHGVPDAPANLELPSGAQIEKLYGGSLIQINTGGGVGIAVQAIDWMPLGGGADDLLDYMRAQTTLEVCEGTLLISGIHAVPAGGPAVEFTYQLDGEVHGRGTVVLVNTTVVLVEMVGVGRATFTPEQTNTYAHAVSSITPVL